MASGVEDHAAFAGLQGKGFTYFQGDYFAKPRLFRHRSVATAGLGSLRYVNSAFFALPRTVGSVREALAQLGVPGS